MFSCEPSSIKAQQRVDRDTTEADQELALGRSPRPRSESQTAAARFALSKCPAVYRESLAFCENFTTFRGKSDVLDPWATLWSSSTSRTSQSNNTSEPRCSAVVQNLVTDRQREEYWGGHNSRIACSFATVGVADWWVRSTSNLSFVGRMLCLNHATRTSSGKRAGSTQHQHLQPSLECPSDLAVPVSV